jgi:DNA-binding MarR family transcriptional regulator
MEKIKESFRRVKEDMDFLKKEVNQIRESVIELCEILKKMPLAEKPRARQDVEKEEEFPGKDVPTHNLYNPTVQHIIPAHNYPFKPQKPPNLPFSTGNEGVPADRQTDQQTDILLKNEQKYDFKTPQFPLENQRNLIKNPKNTENSIENAAEMLKSLDNIKKEIRQKFKKLTEQEWLIFSTIYQLDEEKGESNYREIADKLNLTESSIRDYVARLIKKGIPVEKTKLNNKNIQLKISSNLKRIASLPTIIALRDL